MAVILADSFDFYAASSDMTQIGPWGSSLGASVSSTTRFSFGKSVSINGGATLIKDSWPFGNSSNTIFVALAHYCPTSAGTNASLLVVLRESGSAQVTIEFAGTDQTVKVRTGGTAGTVVGTYPSAFTATTWTHWQIKVVIHNTAGEVHIRKNGDATDTFAVTGINTRGGTTNNYVNGIQLTDSGQATIADDLLVYDNSGAAPNDWVGDIRCYTLLPSANTAQNDFTSNPVTAFASNATGVSTAKTANTLYVSGPFSPGYDGTVTKVTTKLAANVTGNLNACLYDNTNSSNAGNVLATGTAVNNPVTGLVDIVFPTPASVTAAGVYRIGILSDAAFTFDGGNAATPFGFKASVTYGTFPANPALSGTGQTTFYSVVTVLPANYSSVNEAQFNGDASFNYSSTAGNEDLYDLQDLPSTPSNIYCVQARVAVRKSDTGTRNGQLAVKSGATTDLGASVVQATSYGGLLKMYPTDPNTGSAWTAAAVNALQAGVKVSA